LYFPLANLLLAAFIQIFFLAPLFDFFAFGAKARSFQTIASTYTYTRMHTHFRNAANSASQQQHFYSIKSLIYFYSGERERERERAILHALIGAAVERD
jgi:hypothetical protein